MNKTEKAIVFIFSKWRTSAGAGEKKGPEAGFVILRERERAHSL